ncbi:MAG: 5-(carboxyamino)imidazole ribonucleotide synthase [Bacteroidetes bacterium]|nr:5-(carboxyamino)imidazole ribonucleotide synthase [Bacteroidota bacterium]MDA1121721.1 5-(carboxyamino)imidazole ribonucleotide synthase [Bacteroidota bacterium]
MENIYHSGFKLGVLGGGQLGRMLIQSAIDFNLDVKILDPDANAPCKDIATEFVHGKLTDYDTVMSFGRDCDVLTIEIENVNTKALKDLQMMGKKVWPQPEIIELIQDKRVQKEFYRNNNIPTADFSLVENREEVAAQRNRIPFVNKLGKEGYDGRGVQVIRTIEDLESAFDVPGLIEDLIDFDKEISVIVARNESCEIKSFPVVELVFHPTANLVEYLFSPAQISGEIEQKAQKIAKDVIEKLGMVGLLAVEMFVTKDGKVLVNEIAPRTHNSGHQTIEGNVTSQFEQHLRAILSMPLGDTGMVIPTAMVNVLGGAGFTGTAVYQGMKEVLAIDGTHVHLYGKKITKPFRKMGHITITDNDIESLRNKVNLVRNTLKVIA